MANIKLGKINSVRFGKAGYQGVMFGADFSFSYGENGGFGCGWSETANPKDVKPDHTFRVMQNLNKILDDAGVSTFDQLVGKPVELTFNDGGSMLQSWRILTEVL